MTEQSPAKKSLKVYVKMHDGTRMLGSFYIGPSERLQDIMNDERSFLPLYAFNEKSNKQHIVMVAKRYVEQVEEFVPSETTQPAQRSAFKPDQAKPELQDRRTAPENELSLDDTHFEKKRATDQ